MTLKKVLQLKCKLCIIKTEQTNPSKFEVNFSSSLSLLIVVLRQGLTSVVKWPSAFPTGRVLSQRVARISPAQTAFTLRPLLSHPSASTWSQCLARRRCQSPRCPPIVPVRRHSVTAAPVCTVRYSTFLKLS